MSPSIQRARKFFLIVCPSLSSVEQKLLSHALHLALEHMKRCKPFRFTADIYQPIAHTYQLSVCRVRSEMARAIRKCWQDEDNQLLHAVIGCRLPQQPKPCEFLRYCAHYLHYGEPYYPLMEEDEQDASL